MHFGSPHCTIGQPDLGDTLSLSPSARAELLAKPHDVSDFPTHRDRLNITDTTYDFKVQECVLLSPTSALSRARGRGPFAAAKAAAVKRRTPSLFCGAPVIGRANILVGDVDELPLRFPHRELNDR